jgi:putative hydrolase of the HAD superfamily
VCSSYEAVLFDIDGTLCEYNRTVEDLLPVAFERAGVEPFFTPAEYIDRYREFVEASDGVQSLREGTFATLAEESGRDPETGRRVARAYAAERDHANVRFVSGASQVLDAIVEEYPTGVVTNGGPEMQATKLDALGIRERFDPVVYAGYETAAKPDPEPFERAIESLGSDPTRTLYVGNSLTSDVAGARNAGIPVAWLTDGTTEPNPTPDHTLKSLGELAEIL